MVDELHHGAIRVFAIHRSRAIAVGFWFLENRDAVGFKVAVPNVNLVDLIDDEPDVVEPLATPAGWFGSPVQGQIVVSGSQIVVVRIRVPLDLHAHHLGVEAQRSFQ